MFLSEFYTEEDGGELKMLGVEYDMSFWWLCKNFSLKPTYTQFLRVTFDNIEIKEEGWAVNMCKNYSSQ